MDVIARPSRASVTAINFCPATVNRCAAIQSNKMSLRPESASCDQQSVDDPDLASTLAHEHGIEVTLGDMARKIGRKFR
jgi:hypothetical protein